MLTTFVDVKEEYFSLNAEIVETARELLVLEHAVLNTNDEEKFDLYVESYRNFNGLLKDLIGLKVNNLIIWHLKSNVLQIYVMDYLDDGNVYQVVHYPEQEELAANDTQTIVGASLEITTFEEFAEEVTDKELQDMLAQLPFAIADVKERNEVGAVD